MSTSILLPPGISCSLIYQDVLVLFRSFIKTLDFRHLFRHLSPNRFVVGCGIPCRSRPEMALLGPDWKQPCPFISRGLDVLCLPFSLRESLELLLP